MGGIYHKVGFTRNSGGFPVSMAVTPKLLNPQISEGLALAPDTDLRRPTTGLGGALSLFESALRITPDNRLVPLFTAAISVACPLPELPASLQAGAPWPTSPLSRLPSEEEPGSP